MRTTLGMAAALTALLAMGSVAAAQDAGETSAPAPGPASVPKATAVDESAAQDSTADESSWKKGRPITIQYLRALDKRGINVFETTKNPGAEFSGFKLDFGAAFTSQVQNLSHTNTAAPNIVSGVDTNQLADIGFGFNNSTANLALNAQLAPGIRVASCAFSARL